MSKRIRVVITMDEEEYSEFYRILTLEFQTTIVESKETEQ